MNSIQAKIKIYTYSTLALSVITALLYLLAYWLAFDETLHYFSTTTPLPSIARAVLAMSLLWVASGLLFFPRDSFVQLLPDNSIATTFAASLCGFIFFFFSGQQLLAVLGLGTDIFIDSRRTLILTSCTALFGLMTAIYFFTGLTASTKRAQWRVLLGFFPVLWSIVSMADIYFDFYHPMNEPGKVSVMLALIAAVLAMLGELRTILGRPQPRINLVAHYAALLLCGVGGISGLIATNSVRPLAEYRTIFLIIAALWLYFLTYTIDLTRAQSAEQSEVTE